MTRNIFLLVCFGLFLFQSIQLTSQEKPQKEVYKLTHHMSPEEKALFHLVGKDYVETDPPPGDIRNIAEYEKMEGVLVGYPGNFGISYDLIAGISEETVVTTIVENNNQLNYVTGQYQSNGVDMNNATFIVAALDSYWTRDYGPWYVRYGDDQIGIIDFVYNRPNRPNDNAVPPEMADYLGIEWFGMEFITAGGNYMTDGYGVSSSSDLIWEENPSLTPGDIDQMLLDYCGVETYHVLPDPNNTYIDHIDCWGKFLDVDKVLIREVPQSHPQYDEIEATADYYASQTCAWGTSFNVYRVWTPNNEPYSNSLILNNRVFVPIVGGNWDDEALAAYEAAMPGYEILGFTGSWESTDALHCRTKGIADRNTLYIEHYPLLSDQPIQAEYELEAIITAYSGEDIINNEVKVFYEVNGGGMQEIIMTHIGDNLYAATLTGAPEGSVIAYYITATDEGGYTANHPFIGEFDPHIFYVGEQFFPAIALDVTEINAWVNQGDTDVEEFVITNIGQIDLNYNLEWSSAILEDYDYTVDDSPSQSAWENNTYTELGWTEFEIDDVVGEIANFKIDFQWQTDNWPEEGTFKAESPDGTEAIIAAGLAIGNYSISSNAFNGEQMQGTWKLWITDSYGDGGHKASDIEITVTKTYEIAPWLSVAPASGSVTPGGTNTITVTCDGSSMPIGDYEGKIFVFSNDPDLTEIEIPVYFHVDFASGEKNVSMDNIQILNYPNPFSKQTAFEITLPNSTFVNIEIYNQNGQKIKTLVNETLNSDCHSFTWNGNDIAGTKVRSGIYFYKINAGQYEKTGKLILSY